MRGKTSQEAYIWRLEEKKKSNCIKRGKTWVNKSLLVLVVYLIGWESNAGFFLDQSQNVTAKPKYVLLDRFRHSNETFSNHLLFNFHSHLLTSYYFFFQSWECFLQLIIERCTVFLATRLETRTVYQLEMIQFLEMFCYQSCHFY